MREPRHLRRGLLGPEKKKLVYLSATRARMWAFRHFAAVFVSVDQRLRMDE